MGTINGRKQQCGLKKNGSEFRASALPLSPRLHVDAMGMGDEVNNIVAE